MTGVCGLAEARSRSLEANPSELTLPPNHNYSIESGLPNIDYIQSKSGTFTDEHHRQTLAYYYGLVSQIDYNISLVLDELERRELLHKTIIVFTSDHGEFMAEHKAWTKGRLAYDALLRVPLIFSLPGVLPENKISDNLVGSLDILPTLLSISGLPAPTEVQGVDLSPLFHSDTPVRDFLVTETGPDLNNLCVSVRSKEQKYVQFNVDHKVVFEQFFNLSEDP